MGGVVGRLRKPRSRLQGAAIPSGDGVRLRPAEKSHRLGPRSLTEAGDKTLTQGPKRKPPESRGVTPPSTVAQPGRIDATLRFDLDTVADTQDHGSAGTRSFRNELDEAASALPCIVAAPQSPTPPGQGADGDSGLVRQPSQAEPITLTPRQQRGHLLASIHAATMSAFDGETRCDSRDGYHDNGVASTATRCNHLDEPTAARLAAGVLTQTPAPPRKRAEWDSCLLGERPQTQPIPLTSRQQRGHLLASSHRRTMPSSARVARCVSRDGYTEFRGDESSGLQERPVTQTPRRTRHAGWDPDEGGTFPF
jgi:hypothetical protein